MEKIGILTDSASDISFLDYDRDIIKVLPMRITFSDGDFKDGVTITADETYERLDKEIPKTSLPETKDIIEAFEYFKNNGFDTVIGVFISSNLSGTGNQVSNVSSEFPEIKFIKFDSRDLTLSEGLMAKHAGELVKEGKSSDEILRDLESYREKLSTQFVLDTLEYLIKGGRIGKVSGTIGQILNIKPIIHVGDDGIYHPIDKARGKNQAKMKLIQMIKNKVEHEKYNIMIMHGGAKEEGLDFYNQVKNLNLPNIERLTFGQITPSLGVHTGKGLIGFVSEKLD